MKTLLVTSAAFALCAGSAFAQSADVQGSLGPVCDQGFAEIDEDGDGTLKKSEVSNTTKAAFPKLDTNGDGVVTKEEFTACLNTMAGQQAQQGGRRAENMAQYDTDDDGTLTQEEFMQAGSEAAQKAQAGEEGAEEDLARVMFVPVTEVTPDYSTWRPDDYAVRNYMLFVTLDADKSGDITSEEWSAAEPVYPDIREELEKRFEAADTDKSGDLTEEELTEARQKEAEKAQKAAEEAKKSGASADAPVVYFRYDSTM